MSYRPNYTTIFAPTTLAEWSTSGANWSDLGGGIIQNTGTGQYIYKDFTDTYMGLAQRITGSVKVTTGPGTNSLFTVFPWHTTAGVGATHDLECYWLGGGGITIDRKGTTNVDSATLTVTTSTWFPFSITYNGMAITFQIGSKIASGLWAKNPSNNRRVLIYAASTTAQTVQFKDLVVEAFRPT